MRTAIARTAAYWARWLILPVALLVVVTFLPYLLKLLQDALEYRNCHWDDFWFDMTVDVTCAIAWVVITYATTPAHRLLCTLLSLLPGAWLVWYLSGVSTYTVDLLAGDTFETRAPVYVSWWAALATLAVTWMIARHRPAKPEKSVAPTHANTALRFAFLVVAAALFLCMVGPALFIFWRFTEYAGLRELIMNGPEAKVIARIERLNRNPLYDLKWAPIDTLGRIPVCRRVYYTLAGCITCRGHWMTPMLLAAHHGRNEALTRLIELRGGVDEHGDHGAEALFRALVSGNLETVKLVISKGADVNAQAAWPVGKPLHCAALFNSSNDVLAVLLAAGADVNATNTTGKTPLDMANLYRAYNVAAFLLSHGAMSGTNLPAALPKGQKE